MVTTVSSYRPGRTSSSSGRATPYAPTLPAGSFKIQFFPPPGTGLLSQFWNGKPPDFNAADPLVVTADVALIDARLATGFSISGNVTDRTAHAIGNIEVQAFDAVG